MDTPESMVAELGAWNNGKGIDLEGWIACEGRFALAVGYATVFWPDFAERDGYIVGAECPIETIRGFEDGGKASRQSVEATVNHLHLADIQYRGCPDCTPDKLLALGRVLKEIYEAKLRWQFPDKPCVVDLYVPDDRNDLDAYQITFWQKAHETSGA
jgi:hypothetical protein